MNSPLQQLFDPLFEEKKVQFWLKREDLNHPTLPGNKWRKLKYNLQAAKSAGKETLLTFGGAYSNHIAAVAAAGAAFGFSTIGIIRGEEAAIQNKTLMQAVEQGMQLHFISRASYREKENSDFIDQLYTTFGEFYLLPEGGTNDLAVKGCEEIANEITIDYDYLCCSCGTGGTLAGLITADQGHHQLLGFSALKGIQDMEDKISALVMTRSGKQFTNWSVNHQYHFGGYAKLPPELFDFIETFLLKNNILLDPVYTGKMLFGLNDLIRMDYFERGSIIIAIHTGGLQGWNGFEHMI